MTSIYPEPIQYGIPDDSKAVHYFAKELASMGHTVTVYHLYASPVSRLLKKSIKKNHLYENIQDGVNVVCGKVQLIIPHRYAGFKIQQKRIAKKFREYQDTNNKKYDLIITHFPMTMLWFSEEIANKQGISFVMHGVDLREIERLNQKDRIRKIKLLTTNSNVIAYRSVSLKKRAEQLGFYVDDSPVLSSGIPASIIPGINEIERKIKKSKVNQLIFAGKINKQKRVDIILKALSLANANFSLNIVGDGPEKENMEKYANELGVGSYVNFCGHKQREVVAEMMYKSDVFIMVSQNETLGLVYLEAMAQGCIAIGTKGEGIDGIIVNNENGYLIEPNNPDALASLLRKISELDISELHKIQYNAFLTASKMTNRNMTNWYLNELCK